MHASTTTSTFDLQSASGSDTWVWRSLAIAAAACFMIPLAYWQPGGSHATQAGDDPHQTDDHAVLDQHHARDDVELSARSASKKE